MYPPSLSLFRKEGKEVRKALIFMGFVPSLSLPSHPFWRAADSQKGKEKEKSKILAGGIGREGGVLTALFPLPYISPLRYRQGNSTRK